MRVIQHHFYDNCWHPELPTDDSSQLLLSFGSRQLMQDDDFRQKLKVAFPNADNLGCTTSGEIAGSEVYDESLVVNAIDFEHTKVEVHSANIKDYQSSLDIGQELANRLSEQDLRYVLIISDGHLVNGTELVSGITQSLPEEMLVTGGMAGDGDKFQETIVWHNEVVQAGRVVICGFYGSSIRIGHGTLGGWSCFGPQRVITRSKANILYELDGVAALDLYKKYLGEFSQKLPASALRFPLNLQLDGEKYGVVRTILDINEEDKSMIFAGDMPEGATAKLMKANFDRLIDGANGAAVAAVDKLNNQKAEFALLISCVGRRLVLRQRIFEELEAVEEVIGTDCIASGFYSYGEISPIIDSVQCRLHNQTMTITTFFEE